MHLSVALVWDTGKYRDPPPRPPDEELTVIEQIHRLYGNVDAANIISLIERYIILYRN
jgi:hypothetical protein